MSHRQLSAYGLRRALLAGIQRVAARRDEINRINVFPVRDHDAGTNLTFTLGAVAQGLRRPNRGGVGDLLGRIARESFDGARGNTGAILSAYFQGLADTPMAGPRITAAELSRALDEAAAQARAAVTTPVEGTMLTVMKVFADEVRAKVRDGACDPIPCFQQALVRTRAALQETPQQLKVLRSAGVVDAGALGFVELLEGIGEFIAQGRRQARGPSLPEELTAAGVETLAGSELRPEHRFVVECVVTNPVVDRVGLRETLQRLPLAQLVISGLRGQVRLHACCAHPEVFTALVSRFGAVSQLRTEDRQHVTDLTSTQRRRVAIVADTSADIPADAVENLVIHLVPQRLSLAGRDLLDGVSLSAQEFYEQMRTSMQPIRTSQPAPGDFRRMFEHLLTRHERVLLVSVAGSLSGTLQSAQRVATRTAAGRIEIFDSLQVACGQGLLVVWAAEAAQLGLSAERIREGLLRLRAQTSVQAVVRDIRYGVRGGRVPAIALPLTRLLGLSIVLGTRPNGRLGLKGALWSGQRLAERFARRVVRQLSPDRRYRFIIGHGDCLDEAERVRQALLASGLTIDRIWVVATGVAVGAHAGPGSLVIGVQDYEPPLP